MRELLIASGGGRRIGWVQDATFRRCFWTLIHHAAPQRAMRAIAVTVIKAPLGRTLMPSSRLPNLAPTRARRAGLRAISIAAIAVRAQEEDLAALGTHDEAKRLQVPTGGTEGKLLAPARS